MANLSVLNVKANTETERLEESPPTGSLESQIARELIEARVRAGLSQAQLAERMGTSQSTIARLESGRSLPSLRSLIRFADATKSHPVVRLNGILEAAC